MEDHIREEVLGLFCGNLQLFTVCHAQVVVDEKKEGCL
jgi:hypothetical protein